MRFIPLVMYSSALLGKITYPTRFFESMACGTPVVSFRVGGLPDMVIDNVTGALASELSATSLRDSIMKIIADRPRLTSMALLSRQKLVERFREELQAQSIVDLYTSLLDGKS